jgi:phage-related baseplate assembly protein
MMLRFLAVMVVAAMPVSAMAADAKQEALNAVGFRLTLAYHCIPVTGDRAAYDNVKATLPSILAKAGVTSPTFAEIVSAVEEQKQDAPKEITKELCTSLLSMPITLNN